MASRIPDLKVPLLYLVGNVSIGTRERGCDVTVTLRDFYIDTPDDKLEQLINLTYKDDKIENFTRLSANKCSFRVILGE
ncbi:hypothetical protein EfsSzw1_140 [Enterococcus phage EfsSzw-1]|uniref:Uncharacterized protein n=1 Tax=Enterococcus phage EfsSzw-1 TaxID=2419745 RepID=A0A411B7M6_9CAUD|nr:hypothetical protein EfsSzw1_140 [Enterococcus phage EfsSzw-1]